MISIKRIKFFIYNWKLGFHFIFRTKRFGVNNKWWSDGDSMFGWSHTKKIWSIITILPIIDNYKCMKLRAGTMAHFMTDEEYELCFGKKKKAGKL